MIVQSSVSLTWSDYVPCEKGAFGPEPETSKRFIFSEKKKKKKKKIGSEIVVPLKQQNLAKNRFSLSKPPAIKNTTLPPAPPPPRIAVEVIISNGGGFQLHGSDGPQDDCAQLGSECWSCLADLKLSGSDS